MHTFKFSPRSGLRVALNPRMEWMTTLNTTRYVAPQSIASRARIGLNTYSMHGRVRLHVHKDLGLGLQFHEVQIVSTNNLGRYFTICAVLGRNKVVPWCQRTLGNGATLCVWGGGGGTAWGTLVLKRWRPNLCAYIARKHNDAVIMCSWCSLL